MTCPPCTNDCSQGKTCPAKNNNEIIAMARQAGFDLNMWQLSLGCEAFGTHDELIAFAKLVAAKERERIEKEWDKLYGWWTPDEEKNA